MPSPFRITISVDEEVYDALREIAEDESKGIPDVVRDAVHGYMITYWGDTIGGTAERAILAGKTNREALDAVLKGHPGARTTLNSIAFYRSRLRARDPNILTNVQAEKLKQAERPKKKK